MTKESYANEVAEVVRTAKTEVVRSSVKRKALALTMAASSVMLVIGSTGPNRVSDELHMGSLRHACNKSARDQLPKDVVETVEAQRLKGKIPTGDLRTRTIMDGVRNTDWQSSATVMFDPRFCGFIGNIEYTALSDDAKNGTEHTLIELSAHDKVIMTKDGKPFTKYPKGKEEVMCFSDTLPTADVENGSMVVREDCNRVYPGTEWIDPKPDLTPPQ